MELTVTLDRPELRPLLFGPGDANLRTVREALDVQMYARSGSVKITGAPRNVSRAAAVLATLQRRLRHNQPVTPEDVAGAIGTAATEEESQASAEVIDAYGGQMP